MNEPFVRIVGRPKTYDHIKQATIKLLPAWLVNAIRTIKYPLVLMRTKIELRLKVHQALPPHLRKRFYDFYKEARKRWDCGEKTATGKSIELPVGNSGHTIWVRPGTCDVILYYDIMINNHYGKIPIENAQTIIDCGANIGMSCVYFLYRYPNARLIAIEPDPVNYELCIKNLAPFGDRATVLKAALWGKSMSMTVESGNIGTWASTVTVAKGNSGSTIEGFDIPTLLKRYDIESVDILKIDIEGAEFDVFSAENLDWINQIKCFQIELENEDCRKVFMKALSQRGFNFSQYREITIAVRKSVLAEPN